VFDPQARPWIDVEGAIAERTVAQVQQCPSGALSYRMANQTPHSEEKTQKGVNIEAAVNGPLLIEGPVTLSGQHGEQQIDKPRVALCRCGYSSNKPFCDGSHKRQDWQAS
jgi:hypothetical protein